MGPPPTFDVEKRREAKCRSREQDAARIRGGEISADDLNRRSGFFSVLDRASARVVTWRKRIKIEDEPR
ncbi:conserved hypothetical protein [Hyphomicrobiales bacterium]|jgi:hypothetical protein|nr:conserved hypothetical protein [Hyphomicrobiales bacterium]CAH1702489.1 conserved hypothetical protein [Hyphomicrobiales bacterium]CAI0346690.1 conserved hypothetical protein [Hyphomicrobiales bacterium]